MDHPQKKVFPRLYGRDENASSHAKTMAHSFNWPRQSLRPSLMCRSNGAVVGFHLKTYSLNSSRMRLIWPRLTGISVCFLSLIFSM